MDGRASDHPEQPSLQAYQKAPWESVPQHYGAATHVRPHKCRLTGRKVRSPILQVARDYPAWWEGSANGHTLINLEKWNALPYYYQATLLAAAREAGYWMTAKYDAANPPALKRLLSRGVQLRAFSTEIMEACYKAANEVYSETSATNPLFTKIHDSLMSFRSDSYLWWQVAEMTFDSFQARMRSQP
jgi:TRAP-type mannitol/chloroaromatic compound transport system substrate-binding protein